MRLIIAEKPELGRAIADALFTHPDYQKENEEWQVILSMQ